MPGGAPLFADAQTVTFSSRKTGSWFFRQNNIHMYAPTNTSTAPVTPLPGQLGSSVAALRGYLKKHLKAVTVIAIFAAGAALGLLWWNSHTSAAAYTTDRVRRGTVEVNVSSTGTLQAVTTVQVGSQVSGTVAWLGADFKSHVKRGQVIAKLDPALVQAQVDTQRANLIKAQAGVRAALAEIQNQTANVEAAKANNQAYAADRDDAIAIAKEDQQLRGVIPEREIQAAQNQARIAVARNGQAGSQIGQAQAQLQISQSQLKQAQSVVAQAEAQLAQANISLQYAIIVSPIDGTIISRSVDVGQTVAASLQAPTLFTIANDLTNMQVLASIDEADVGQVHEGLAASFTVDAYPNRRFSGEVVQLRLNAQTLQNVVTYTAVISVKNPNEELMPGMTASVTIAVAKSDNVLLLANAALRFKPDLSVQQQAEFSRKLDEFRRQQQAKNQSANEPESVAAGSSGGSANQQIQSVWILSSSNVLEPHFVVKGITDGRVTEILSGTVNEGDRVVTGQTTSASPNQSPAAPAGQRPASAAAPRTR